MIKLPDLYNGQKIEGSYDSYNSKKDEEERKRLEDEQSEKEEFQKKIQKSLEKVLDEKYEDGLVDIMKKDKDSHKRYRTGNSYEM